MSSEMDMFLKLLATDKNVVVYRKSFNLITKKINASILLQQLIYWHTKMNGPFFKFIEPCRHPAYKTGDSWTEELGFTKKEFSSAYRTLENLRIVSKKINMNRVTHYSLDLEVLSKLLKGIYLGVDMDDIQIQKKELDSITETTVETTADINIPYEDIIHHLNLILLTSYNWTSQHTQSLINERWNEGFRVEDFKIVHINKFAEWSNNSKMSRYLRPATLYSKNFEGYRNQKLTSKDKANAIQLRTGMGAIEKLNMKLNSSEEAKR